MSLSSVLYRLGIVLAILIVVVGAIVLRGTDVARFRSEYRQRLRIGLPALVVLGGVLLLNAIFRTAAEELSWLIGFNITGRIYGIEGELVFWIQSFFGASMVGFFSFMYVYGYVLLLVFPLIAYVTLQRLDVFQELTIAYTMNYTIGLICYIFFIAYGPRNLIPELVGAPLYTEYPDVKLLTSVVNRQTNVFPSLHASLSATAMLFAWRTRESLPAWLPIAVFVGSGVIVSTMYLAIHWFIDVLAGLALAGISTWGGIHLHERGYIQKLSTSIENALAKVPRSS